MRHRKRGRKLNRSSSHRRALKRNLITSLFKYGRIITTVPKAKEFAPYAERLITLAKVKSLHNYRQALSVIQDKMVAKKLFDEIAPSFKDRPGGYTRIVKLAKRRLADNASRAIFELVTFVPKPKVEKKKKEKSKAAAS